MKPNMESLMTTSILFHHFIVLSREITTKCSQKSMTVIYTTLIQNKKHWSLHIVWLEIVQHPLQKQSKSRENLNNKLIIKLIITFPLFKLSLIIWPLYFHDPFNTFKSCIVQQTPPSPPDPLKHQLEQKDLNLLLYIL